MRTTLKCFLGVALCAALTAGCGKEELPSSAPALPGSALSDAVASAASSTASITRNAAKQTFADRNGQLLNPDDSTVVLLYYDLTGIAPPIETWVEDDSRVRFAPAPDKAARRAAVRAELEAAAQGVRGVGLIRLSMNADLSEYDPTYEEFTIGALSPSSVVTFNALGQRISLRFANGNDAQVWRVPAAQSQAIRDRIGYGRGNLDVRLKIVSVQPAPAGGTIVTEVLDYELRESHRGAALARVQVSPGK